MNKPSGAGLIFPYDMRADCSGLYISTGSTPALFGPSIGSDTTLALTEVLRFRSIHSTHSEVECFSVHSIRISAISGAEINPRR